MALRDQPYLPLYIQDIMTDEKLNECCAATHGIFIKGIMCLMHKSDEYGKILLKQKDQQTDSNVRNFAIKIKKHTPYTVEEIEAALFELLAEKVLYIEDGALCQKRMIEDNKLSQMRSKAGKSSAKVKTAKGTKDGFATTKDSTNAITKEPANPEYEIEYENENEIKPVIEFKEKEQKTVLSETDIDLDDEALSEVSYWTNEVIAGNDYRFKPPKEIPLERVHSLARDHLGKCARYGWHEKMTSQQAFRISLLNFIAENQGNQIDKSKGKQPTKSISYEDLKRNGSA